MSIDDLRISIKELKSETKEMMELCEVAIEKSVDSIVNKDLDLAREVIKMDDDIDNLRNKIIEKSIELTALKQPMAKDLRNVYALSTIAMELETKLAYDAALEDNIVDDLYNDVYVNLLAAMHKDSNNINQGVKLIFVARYLERIGDHITNVCENIVYAIKGDMTELG